MFRPLRITHTGVFYHFTSRGNERKTILKEGLTERNSYPSGKTHLRFLRNKGSFCMNCK